MCQDCEPIALHATIAEAQYRLEALTRYRDELRDDLVKVEQERSMLLANLPYETRR